MVGRKKMGRRAGRWKPAHRRGDGGDARSLQQCPLQSPSITLGARAGSLTLSGITGEGRNRFFDSNSFKAARVPGARSVTKQIDCRMAPGGNRDWCVTESNRSTAVSDSERNRKRQEISNMQLYGVK